MNLWLRLFWLLIMSRFRSALAIPGDASILNFRVWPHDLDTSMHMNNGRYLALMDLGRLDVIARTGLLAAALKYRWAPIARAVFISFRRELLAFQKFRLETRLLCWTETIAVMEQTFFIVGGHRDGQLAARALFQGGLYDRSSRSFVTTSEIMEAAGVSAESPQPSPEVADFLKNSEVAARATDRAT
jgi:acyl-CoA thioesterase FadM